MISLQEMKEPEESSKEKNFQPIDCEQVTDLLNAIERYLPENKEPAISRKHEMLKFSLLYEIIKIAKLEFEDSRARWNATPNDVRNYGPE
jgi:hypothetical protein